MIDPEMKIELWKLGYRRKTGPQILTEWYATKGQAESRVVDLRYQIEDVNIQAITLDVSRKSDILALLNAK